YMVAIPLIFGRLTARDYEDEIAADPRIDALREKMSCVEDLQFTKDYHDPEKRSIANAMTITFKDGTSTEEIAIEYPVGHKRRREEGLPLLVKKYRTNLARIYNAEQQERIASLTLVYAKLSATPVNEVLDLFVKRD
ncbi:MAG: 2-methylcitrate dehydratase, partial [Actinomycetota bacterium]